MKITNLYQRVSHFSFVCDICHKQIEDDTEQVVIDVSLTRDSGFNLLACMPCSTDSTSIQAVAEAIVNK